MKAERIPGAMVSMNIGGDMMSGMDMMGAPVGTGAMGTGMGSMGLGKGRRNAKMPKGMGKAMGKAMVEMQGMTPARALGAVMRAVKPAPVHRPPTHVAPVVVPQAGPRRPAGGDLRRPGGKAGNQKQQLTGKGTKKKGKK
jgi:hypothetical protein